MGVGRTRAAIVGLGACVMAAAVPAAQAEFQISVYGGWQTAPHSNVEVTGANPESFTARWLGRSFETPPYYGIRGTYWFQQAPEWGVSLDFAHAKVYADDDTLQNQANNWSRFEFSDGINILTLNAMRRFAEWNNFEPYVGLGAGISIPHVEVTRPASPEQTFGYQIGGAAFQAQAGVNYRLTEHFSIFGEYKFNYTINDVSLDDGDRLRTDIITNAVIGGASVHF